MGNRVKVALQYCHVDRQCLKYDHLPVGAGQVNQTHTDSYVMEQHIEELRGTIAQYEIQHAGRF